MAFRCALPAALVCAAIFPARANKEGLDMDAVNNTNASEESYWLPVMQQSTLMPTTMPTATPGTATPLPTALPTYATDVQYEVVEVAFTVEGVEFDVIDNDPVLKQALTNKIVTECAQSASVDPTYVKVIFSAGSVVVTCEISAPPGTSVADIETAVAADTTLSTQLVTAINEIPELAGAATISTPITAATATTGGTTIKASGGGAASAAVGLTTNHVSGAAMLLLAAAAVPASL